MESSIGSDAASLQPLAPKSLLAERYEIDSLQGQGRLGLVYLAHDKQLQTDVAIKEIKSELISREGSTKQSVLSQLNIAQSMSHPSVIDTIDYFTEDDTFYIVMTWIDGDSLRNAIAYQQLSVGRKYFIVQQLIDALIYSEKVGISHGAISLDNIMIDKHGRAFIADFGLNPLEQRNIRDCTIEQLSYLPPEVIKTAKTETQQDWYALGVATFELFNHKNPFDLTSQNSLYQSKLDINRIRRYSRSGAATKLVSGLLNPDIDNRVDSGEKVQHLFYESIRNQDDRSHTPNLITAVVFSAAVSFLAAYYLFT